MGPAGGTRRSSVGHQGLAPPVEKAMMEFGKEEHVSMHMERGPRNSSFDNESNRSDEKFHAKTSVRFKEVYSEMDDIDAQFEVARADNAKLKHKLMDAMQGT